MTLGKRNRDFLRESIENQPLFAAPLEGKYFRSSSSGDKLFLDCPT